MQHDIDWGILKIRNVLITLDRLDDLGRELFDEQRRLSREDVVQLFYAAQVLREIERAQGTLQSVVNSVVVKELR